MIDHIAGARITQLAMDGYGLKLAYSPTTSSWYAHFVDCDDSEDPIEFIGYGPSASQAIGMAWSSVRDYEASKITQLVMVENEDE